MNKRYKFLFRSIIAVVALQLGGAYAADVEHGKVVFSQCAGCHMVGDGAQHRFGPSLNALIDQPAGSAGDYDYSAALKQAAGDGLVWTTESLDEFLQAPMQSMPGTKMAYPGLSSETDRADVIAYLATFGAPQETSVEAQETDNGEPAVRPLASDFEVPSHGVLHLGRTALPEEVTAWDIDIRPDGQGLPQGRGNVTDGTDLYDAQCAACHGVFGEGEGRWPILAGGFDTLTEERPEKTIGSYWPYLSTVYDYVRRAMPFGNARSLSDDDVYAITVYLMYLNDLVDEDFELSSDNFGEVRLPNEDNFIDDTRAEEPSFVATAEPCMSDCIEGQAAIVQRARILDVTPDEE